MNKYLQPSRYYRFATGRGRTITAHLYQIIKTPAWWKYLPLWLKSQLKKGSPLADGTPWITLGAIAWLDHYLNRTMTVFEWGSGGSTVYLSKKVNRIVSIEHDAAWYEKVLAELKTRKITRCHCQLIGPTDDALRPDVPGHYTQSNKESTKSFENYCRAVEAYPDNHFNLIIVDGRARNSCVFSGISKVKPGGALLLDNSDRPEYAEGINQIPKNWQRMDFYGPGPYNGYLWQTSIFKKPTS